MRPHTAADGAAELDAAALLRRARELRQRSYSPYSHLRVGAVVLSERGGVYEGVNVENASFRMTICAEQAAVAAMVSAGDRGPIVAVAIVGDGDLPCTPCGACRQTLRELGPDAAVFASGDGGHPLSTTVRELLPHGFGPAHLGGAAR